MNKTIGTLFFAGVALVVSTAAFGKNEIEIGASAVVVKSVRFGQSIEQVKAELGKSFKRVECSRPSECVASNDKEGAKDKLSVELGEVGTVWNIRYQGDFQVGQNAAECQKIARTTFVDIYRSIGQVLGKPVNADNYNIHAKFAANDYFDFSTRNNSIGKGIDIKGGGEFHASVGCEKTGVMNVSIEAISLAERERRAAVKTTEKPKF
jgi:hypothetical protein